MKAIIIAAGEGRRMHPLTFEKPKQLLEILGKPIIEYIWDALPDVITEVVLVVGYKADMLKNYLGDEYRGKKIHYILQEKPMGTAHALFLCKSFINKGEKFLTMFADDLHDKNSIMKCLEKEYAILVANVENPREFGTVITNTEGRVTEMEEKPEHPKTNLVNVGVYVFDDHIFTYPMPEPEPTKGEYFLTPIIEQLSKDRDVYAIETKFWIPIGYPDDLQKAEKILLQMREKNTEKAGN